MEGISLISLLVHLPSSLLVISSLWFKIHSQQRYALLNVWVITDADFGEETFAQFLVIKQFPSMR